MKFREATIGVGTLALAVSSSYAFAQTPPPMSDAAFVQAAQTGNDQEIADARYMLGVSKNAQVRTYANAMISDHSTANVELLKAARNAHVPVPQRMRRDVAMTATDALRGLSGAPLNRAYVDGQIAGHEKMLAMVKAEEASSTADASLKAFATTLEPTVQKHLDDANNIKNTGSQATPGTIFGSNAPGSAGAPSPIFTQQTNGSVPTAVPISSTAPSAAPSPAGSANASAPPVQTPPTHSP